MTYKVVDGAIEETRTVTRVETVDDLKREKEMLTEEINRAQSEIDRATAALAEVNAKLKAIFDAKKAVR